MNRLKTLGQIAFETMRDTDEGFTLEYGLWLDKPHHEKAIYEQAANAVYREIQERRNAESATKEETMNTEHTQPQQQSNQGAEAQKPNAGTPQPKSLGQIVYEALYASRPREYIGLVMYLWDELKPETKGRFNEAAIAATTAYCNRHSKNTGTFELMDQIAVLRRQNNALANLVKDTRESKEKVEKELGESIVEANALRSHCSKLQKKLDMYQKATEAMNDALTE